MQDSHIEKFTSYPSCSCLISVEKIDGNNVLKFDFAIKEYQVVNRSFNETYKFPDNIVINDKIYCDEKLKNELLDTLDIFIKTEYLPRNYKTNSIGLPYNDWEDVKGNIISIEDSGSMNAAQIILKCKTKDILIKTSHGLEEYQFEIPKDKVCMKNRLSLSPEEAKQLKELIQRQWILNEVKELNEYLPENKSIKNKFKV